MITFNCTKSATNQLSVTRQGKTINCFSPVPENSLVEAVNLPVEWHWVVNCVSILRKKYFVVMDYNSRFGMVFPAGKKGDDVAFANAFEAHLLANVRYLALEKGMNLKDISCCIDNFFAQNTRCFFYQRSDKSVLAHMKDVVWHLEDFCYETGALTASMDCLNVTIFANEIPRRTKSVKGFFIPKEIFFANWLKYFYASTYH